MSQPPKWFRPLAVLALVWNLLGCMAYLSDVTLKPDDVAKMPPAMQDLYKSRTPWAVAATATAVWAGALGSLGLTLFRKWAAPFLVASLLGVIVQDAGLFLMTNAAQVMGPAVYAIQGMVLLIAVGLILLARKASASGWLT